MICAEKTKVKEVREIISSRVGKENAIKKSEIMKMTGLPERKVRKIIKFLVEVQNVPIASSSSMPYGYYLVAPRDDGAGARELRGRAYDLIRRASILEGNTPKEQVKQMELELEKKGDDPK